MSNTLKTLLNDAAELENKLIETAGELSDELEKKLMELNVQIPAKVQKYIGLLDRLEIESNNLYSKAKKYEMAAKSLNGLHERLLSHVKHLMKENELSELRGTDETFKLTKGKPAVIITDLSRIPREFIVQTITQRAEKDALYNRLSNGEKIPGCELQETTRLTRKVIT